MKIILSIFTFLSSIEFVQATQDPFWNTTSPTFDSAKIIKEETLEHWTFTTKEEERKEKITRILEVRNFTPNKFIDLIRIAKGKTAEIFVSEEDLVIESEIGALAHYESSARLFICTEMQPFISTLNIFEGYALIPQKIKLHIIKEIENFQLIGKNEFPFFNDSCEEIDPNTFTAI